MKILKITTGIVSIFYKDMFVAVVAFFFSLVRLLEFVGIDNSRLSLKPFVLFSILSIIH